ncbi:MAG: RagB/SusD family nutrient uptake outer membrane protein [Muribaculaceae bacterium]
MKKYQIFSLAAIACASLASCNDFLDENRYPISVEVDNPLFWSETANCDKQCDQLYSYYSGYGRGNTLGEFYFQTLSDDQCGGGFVQWNNTNVPASSSNYTTPYQVIRHCEYIIAGMQVSSLDAAVRANYEGIARLNRAQQYFSLVKMYGDVKWVDKVVDITDDGILYAERDNRDEVMDKVLADLTYACENISAQSGKLSWSKDMANAIKSYICLWEGTFCRYRTQAENGYAPDEARAKKFLEESVKAAEAVMSQNYSLNDDYRTKYISLSADLQKNNEVIFMRNYLDGVLMHSTESYAASSTIISGLTKDLFDAYLFSDGLPKALTSCDTNDKGEMGEDGFLHIDKLLAVRDKRLAETTDPCVYYSGFQWTRVGASGLTSSTGYGVSKFDNTSITPLSARTNTTKNYICAPLLWLSDIYCQFAEAKAELGTLTDADLNKSINKIFERSGLPTRTVAELSAIADPANNMGVSNLLWEIRRCRRCELVMDKGYRYWDLVRWHQLDKLDNSVYPNIALGANMAGGPNPNGVATDAAGYINGYYGGVRTYEPRQYLYPIPQNQLNLAPKLEQNPLWK